MFLYRGTKTLYCGGSQIHRLPVIKSPISEQVSVYHYGRRDALLWGSLSLTLGHRRHLKIMIMTHYHDVPMGII